MQVDRQKLRKEIFAKYPPEQNHLARAEWRRVRQRLYNQMIDNNPRRFDWERDFPPDIVRWARSEFTRLVEEREAACVDNFRVCRLSRPRKGSAQYRKQRRDGCCGSTDVRITGPDGITYRLGFNYGH